jgi:serine/threonine-protein kinase
MNAPGEGGGELPERFGPFLLIKAIGRGSGGEVFLAETREPGMPARVVVKRLLPELHAVPELAQRFRHEAELAQRIDSPHLPKVYRSGTIDERLYFAQEAIDGRPLSNVMQQLRESKQRAELAWVVKLMSGALLGLHALHTAKDANGAPLSVVHRDVSPKNIMVTGGDETRLIDLGIGRSNIQDFETRTGIVLGSPGHMSPEQVLGYTLDHRADLYAVAVIVWELLSGERYIERGPVQQMMRASIRPPYRSVRATRPDVPVELDAVLKKALARAPAERFFGGDELLNALEVVILDERTEPLGDAKTVATQPKRSRGPVLQAVAALFVSLVALAAIIGLDRAPEGPIEETVEAVSSPVVASPSARPLANAGADAGADAGIEVADAAVVLVPSKPREVHPRRAANAGVTASPVPEKVVEVPVETYVDDLIQRAVTLTQSYPGGAPSEVLQVLNDLNLLRGSPRLWRERDAAEVLAKKLLRLEKQR